MHVTFSSSSSCAKKNMMKGRRQVELCGHLVCLESVIILDPVCKEKGDKGEDGYTGIFSSLSQHHSNDFS